jgi:threonine/homoserine/homoserine lactone efflux protein
MNLSTWWLFVTATFFISAAPGPNMLLIMNQSVRFGLRASMASMAGCMTALMIMFTMSALGLGVILQSAPAVFDALRWAGALYLAYLGYKVWTAPVEPITQPTLNQTVENKYGYNENSYNKNSNKGNKYASYSQKIPLLEQVKHFKLGFFTAGSNPKALLFAAALLPQFITSNLPQVPQLVILLLTFSVLEILWYFIYALGGLSMAQQLRKPNVLRWFNRVTGGAFIGFAGVMAVIKH